MLSPHSMRAEDSTAPLLSKLSGAGFEIADRAAEQACAALCVPFTVRGRLSKPLKGIFASRVNNRQRS